MWSEFRGNGASRSITEDLVDVIIHERVQERCNNCSTFPETCIILDTLLGQWFRIRENPTDASELLKVAACMQITSIVCMMSLNKITD